MNKTLTLTGLAGLMLAAPALHAQETARVVSSVPMYQQVAVPRQVCTTQQVAVEQPKSGAGALMGAIAGGAIGNQIGGGSGRAAATAAGVIGGALLGNNIEGPAGTRMQDQTTCATQTVYENRLQGYNVTYEYAGRQYQVQMPQDPGPTLRVQVTPVMPGGSVGTSQPWQAPGGPVQTWQAPPPPATVVPPSRPYSQAPVYYAPVVWTVGTAGAPYPGWRPHSHWR